MEDGAHLGAAGLVASAGWRVRVALALGHEVQGLDLDRVAPDRRGSQPERPEGRPQRDASAQGGGGVDPVGVELAVGDEVDAHHAGALAQRGPRDGALVGTGVAPAEERAGSPVHPHAKHDFADGVAIDGDRVAGHQIGALELAKHQAPPVDRGRGAHRL